MRVLLIITDADFYAGTGYAEAWTEALEAEGCEVRRAARPEPGLDPAEFDLAIAHVLNEEVAVFDGTMRLAASAEQAGVPLLNPLVTILVAADKRLNADAWARAGVPQPRAYDLDALEVWPEAGAPLVCKPALGDGARNIELVESLDEARRVVAGWRDFEREGGAQLQQWIRDPAVVRLFATPDSVSSAYEKDREEGALVTHGTVYPHVYEPDDDMASLAQRMVESLGGGLMGVDVLRDGDDLLALEANAPFGFDVTDPEQGRFVARAAMARARATARG